MSREIKFRAWDRTRKCFIHVPDIKDLLFSYGNNYDYTKGDDVELTQYTGLKDVNGKEIFEGDVCRFPNDDKFIARIERWLECYGEWIGEPECDDQLRDFYRAEKSTIIGNIYEHPHLLEES